MHFVGFLLCLLFIYLLTATLLIVYVETRLEDLRYEVIQIVSSACAWA